MRSDLKVRVETLTSGELDVLRLAAEHLRSHEIAHRLGIAPKTVDARMSRAMKRLGVSDRDSAVRLLIEAAHTPWGKTLGLLPLLAEAAGPPASLSTPRLPLPWPTRWRPENDHPFAIKLLLVLILAVAMMGTVAVYLLAIVLIDRSFPRS